jgi:dual specificity tyrosine-phosphorylation-regulated kinase 2/3/4
VGLIRRFTVQLLQSLELLHEHKIVHCDLKPENILLLQPTKSQIKMIDFGSSCFENERLYTYIQSRFYRSPEVILGIEYGMPIDMWSLGCILAELFTGYPLFPGENEQEQLLCIMEIMDVPPMDLLGKSSRRKVFFTSNNEPRVIPNSKGKKRYPNRKSLESALKCNDPLFVDFIRKCLHWDPEKRMTPMEAMEHPWIRGATEQAPLKSVISSISGMAVTPPNGGLSVNASALELKSTPQKLSSQSRSHHKHQMSPRKVYVEYFNYW